MQISLKIVNLVVFLIYVTIADSQYRGNPNIDDLVAAIATAAINGALPLHRMGNLRNGNPNRKGDVLRIPILLISSSDLKRKKGQNWNNKNGRPRNGRDFLKKDYSPKPKYPTQGLKVIPAPKEFEYEKNELKKNFDKKPINPVQINNRYNDRHGDFDDRDRFEDNYANDVNRGSADRFNRNRQIDDQQQQHGYDRQNDRLPLRPADNWRELPEREADRPVDDIDYVDDKIGDQLPALKPIVKVPTIVRHVYGGSSPLESGKPTIPPRYLKAVADIPSTSDSTQYDNSRDVYNPQMSKIPQLSDLLPPPDEQGVTYKTDPVVNHKYVNLGDVYRKANSEDGEEEPLPLDDSDGPLAGYAKDQYDKQLIGTLTKLMQNSKNRSPLNIGGLGGASSESTQAIKPVTKTTKNYFISPSSGDSSQTAVKTDSFLSKYPSIFNSGTGQSSSVSQTRSKPPITLQSQTTQSQSINSQSIIPESLLSPFSLNPSTSSQGSAADYLSPLKSDQQVLLRPGQVPLLPEVSRKPVALDLGFDSGTRPLSAYSVFNAAEDSA